MDDDRIGHRREALDSPVSQGQTQARWHQDWLARVRTASHSEIALDRFQVGSALILLTLMAEARSTLWLSEWVIPALFVGLVLPMLTRHKPWYWIGLLAILLVSGRRAGFLTLDNHHFLQMYVIAAIGLSRVAGRPEKALATASRWLIAAVFASAVVWKLMTPDFLSGDAVAFLVSTEPRLAEAAAFVDLHPEDTMRKNRAELLAWHDPEHPPTARPAAVSDAVLDLAPTFARLTIAVEALVAIAFAVPLGTRWAWLRDAALLSFALLTYPFAPVIGFAWTLFALGLFQSPLPQRARNVSYLVLAAAMPILQARDDVVFPLLERLLG